MRAGAQGYLLKDIRPDDLVQAVRDAYQGKAQLAPEIAKKLMTIVAGSLSSPDSSPPSPADPDLKDAKQAQS